MSSYRFLAPSYDVLTRDVDYSAWADFAEKQFARGKLPIHTVLDLACGTGSLTAILAERGYEMIGVDYSADMLHVAAEKGRQAAGIPPIFLQQSMDKLDLYGTIDACVCALDSINYVTRPRQLAKAFQRVHLFLMPGGLFLFDFRTPEALENMDGQVFLDETEDTYCVWRGEYSAARRICTYGMDIFRKSGSVWLRGEELHEEYAYTSQELIEMLQEAGFRDIRLFGDRKFRRPKAGEDRVFVAARKGE